MECRQTDSVVLDTISAPLYKLTLAMGSAAAMLPYNSRPSPTMLSCTTGRLKGVEHVANDQKART